MGKLIIKFNDGTFHFCVDEKKWCVLSFVSKEKEIKLGAENINILCQKLIKKLSDIKSGKTFIYKNIETYPIVNLSDPHSSLIYYMLNDNTIQIMFEDKAGILIPLISLDEKERLMFVNKIKIYYSEFNQEKSAK